MGRYESLIRREVRLQLDDQNLLRLFDSMDICQSVLASFFVRTAAGEYDIGSTAQLVKLLVNMARNKLISAVRREYMQRRDVRRRTRQGDPALDQIADQRQAPADELANRELLSRIYERLSPEELQISKLRSSGAAWTDVASEMGGTSQSRACSSRVPSTAWRDSSASTLPVEWPPACMLRRIGNDPRNS